MPRNNPEDATAKALDLLPHDDPARSDPRLVRDAQCLEEIRATQEAAADVWLATSPLRAAPPELLTSIMSKVEARTPLAHRNVKFFPWLAASGWVAASIAFLLWPRDGENAPTVAGVDRPVYMRQQPRAGLPATPSEGGGLPALPDRRSVPGDLRTREAMQRLQAQLHSLKEQGAFYAPRVLSLHSPNAVQPEPEEVQRRMVAILTQALRLQVVSESGATGDPAQLVLHRGWVQGSALADGEYVRHLNFPLNALEENGLTVSEDGAYYDAAREMIWYPDESGQGFLGRRATDEDDLLRFHAPDEPTLVQSKVPQVVARSEPEGYVVEDPENNSANVLIDQVPPPAEGFQQVVIYTDSQGKETRIPVQNPLVAPASAPSLPSESPAFTAPMSVISSAAATTKEVLLAAGASIPVIPSIAQAGTGSLFFTLPDSNGVKSFSLVEVPTVANGKPPKVIVSGERGPQKSKLR